MKCPTCQHDVPKNIGIWETNDIFICPKCTAISIFRDNVLRNPTRKEFEELPIGIWETIAFKRKQALENLGGVAFVQKTLPEGIEHVEINIISSHENGTIVYYSCDKKSLKLILHKIKKKL